MHMLLFGAEHGLPERGMSSTQAALEQLAGQQGAGSHRRQLQHLTLPPAVCSQHHYSPLLVVTSSKAKLQTLRI